ncbi:uncharacterized protein KIAA1671 homolog [Gastrophryne carolinensis]
MTTRVEVTPRTNRSDRLTEGKPSRSYVSPLSDASNKSSDSNMSSSLIIEESTGVPSKAVNMFNSGMKPRMSPKPFTRENSQEKRLLGFIPALSADVKPQSNVPFQTSTSISLSGSPKGEEQERVGRRIITSIRQASTEEDQVNKSDNFSSAALNRKQPSLNWTPTAVIETSSSSVEEPKVTAKPPLMPRKLDISQQQEKYSFSSITKSANDATNEQKASLEKVKNSFQSDAMDSLAVRAQLRPKRRPVSAMFLDSINDQTTESKIVDNQRTSNRRPLSEDLTTLFESRGLGNKAEIPSEEFKENRPLKRNSFNRSITEDQPDVASKAGELATTSASSETRTGTSGVFSRNRFSARMSKVTTEERSNNQQETSVVPEHDPVVRRSVNSNNQVSRTSYDNSDCLTGEVKNTDDHEIVPGITKRRISLYLANSDSSVESEDVPTSKEDKNNLNTERANKEIISDKDMESGRSWLTSKSQAADKVKTVFNLGAYIFLLATVELYLIRSMGTVALTWFSTSSPIVEPRSEKTVEERQAFALQDYGIQKERKVWKTSDVSEEKQRFRRSFKNTEESLLIEDRKNVLNKAKTHVSKDILYSSKTEEADNKYKDLAKLDNTSRTVKATMFEHNVERHSPPEVISAIIPAGKYPRSEFLSQRLEVKKESGNWSKWLSGDSVDSVASCEFNKNHDDHDSKSNKSQVQVASSARYSDDLQNTKTFHEKRRIEPRYEVIQAIGERVSSEYIQMAPEDKAVTLRSRRSFHRKEKEFDNSEAEGSAFSRPASNLRRSKSEYRKKVPQENTQERSADTYFSKDLGFLFRKDFKSAEKPEQIKAPDDTNNNKSLVDTFASNVQQKSYKLDYKPKRDSIIDQVSTKQPSLEITTTDSKEYKGYVKDYNWHKNKQSSDPEENRLDNKQKNTFKDEQTINRSNVKDDVNNIPHMNEFNKQSHQRSRFLSDKDSISVHNTEPKDAISIMLNKEIHQIKKDLVVPQAKKDSTVVSSERPHKEEHSNEYKWERKKASFQDKNTSGYSTGSMLEALSPDHDESSRKQNMPTIKGTSRTESKATYFVVTGLDNRKKQKDSNFEGLSTPASSWTSEEYHFKRESSMNATCWGSDSNYKLEEKNILGTPDTSKKLNAYRLQKEDVVPKVEKPLEKQSIVDIDALLKRHKQKPDLDSKSSMRRDFPARHERNISETDKRPVSDTTLNFDASYKSKAVDIDSLMADYSASHQKEWTSKEDKWERSRSFKEGASKGSSGKWKDPSIKPFSTEESYQFETVGSWYSSRESTSTKDLKSNQEKSTHFGSPTFSLTDKKYPDMGREQQYFQPLSEKSPIITNSDCLLESFKRTRESIRTQSKQDQEFPTDTADWSISHNVKTELVEMTVDGDSQEISNAVRLQDRVSVQSTTISVSSEQVPPQSEGKRPSKASDLISLMLENGAKRKESQQTGQSFPVEHSQETHRLKYQHELYYSKSKDHSVKEGSKQWTKLQEEQEVIIDLPRRKSLNRQRERDLILEQDHVKQCFSRSSTSNKDTDSLVQDPEQKYGTWSQDKPNEDSCVTESPSYDNSSRKQQSHSRLSSLSHTETDQHDSITEARDVSLDRCSMDSTDGTESTPSFNEAKGTDFPVVDQTSVLDSTALKNRVQLSRESQRRAPSRTHRRSRLLQPSSQLAVIEDTDNPWMYTDSTEAKPEKKEEVEEEEEKPKRSSVHSPRMPVFPGMDQSTLMAQLRKRQDAESSSESSPQPKSPKSPLPHGTLGVKLLPTPGDKQDKGAGESPQWLKELKSKKRLSQYENPS